MRRRKKGLLAMACAAFLLGLLVPASGAVDNVNLMAVNERVLLDITPENMPRTVGGVLYVPYTMLSTQAADNINLGVTALYSTTKRTVLVTDGRQRGVIFDIQSNTAKDLDGNPVSARAMVRNSTVFIPIDWLCEYFGTITCTRTPTPFGTVIRVTNSAAILSDQAFAGAARPQLAAALNRYLEAGGLGEGGDPVPSGSGAETPSPGGAELYLAFRWGSEARECARLVEGRGQRALFLFTLEELAREGDLVRRVVGAGHTVGLALVEGDLENCLREAERGRELLAAAARYNVLVASAPNLDGEGREALEAEGFVVWSTTVRGEDYASGSALARALDLRRMNFVEVECGAGSTVLLRGALNTMEEENCRIYQATAPALA